MNYQGLLQAAASHEQPTQKQNTEGNIKHHCLESCLPTSSPQNLKHPHLLYVTERTIPTALLLLCCCTEQ